MAIKKYITMGDKTHEVVFNDFNIVITGEAGEHVASMTYDFAAKVLVKDVLTDKPKKNS